jgi:hypothetical protein
MPPFRYFVVHFLPWKPEFNLKIVDLRFMMEKVAGFPPTPSILSYDFSFQECSSIIRGRYCRLF